MVNFFTYSANDQSIYYLDTIFGYMDNVLPVSVGTTTIISVLLKTVNTTALILATIFLVNTTVRGILKTAQEGEFLGREWSSLWVPLRTVMGMASLFPTTAGYSLLQIALMWVIVQGVGAADTLWTTVLKYVSATGSPYSNIVAGNTASTSSGTGSSISVPTAMKSLLYGLTCQETLARTDAITFTYNSSNSTDSFTGSLYYCNANGASDPFCAMNASDRANPLTTPPGTIPGYYSYVMGPNGICGTMTFPNAATYIDPKNTAGGVVCQGTTATQIEQCAGIKAQTQSLKEIVGTLSTYAATIAEMDKEYFLFYYGYGNSGKTLFPTPTWISNFCNANGISPSNCCMPANAPSGSTNCRAASNFYDAFGDGTTYKFADESQNASQKIIWPYGIAPALGSSTDVVGTMANKYIGDVNTAVANATVSQTKVDSFYSDTESMGWISAGTYYYTLASQSNSALASAMPPLSVVASNPTTSTSNTVPTNRINFQTATDIESAISNSSSASSSPVAASASSSLNGMASAISTNFINAISGGGTLSNPLQSAQAFGENLLISVQVTYPILLIASTALIVVSNIDVLVLGNGLTENPVGPAVEFTVLALWGVFILFAGWCITFGGLLAIYMPLVPYIIFTLAAIGWLISVIEAMVAAPFVAIGIMSPTGHEIWGRAEPAIMLMLSVFLRPTLLIVGMMAGMVLAPCVITMINGGFNVVVGSIYSGARAPGPVEMILFITAYGTLVCTSMNKCFAVIYMVPDRVLTWLGGQAASGGEAEGLRESQSGFEATTGAIRDMAGSAAGALHERAAETGRVIGAENRVIGENIAKAQAAKVSGKANQTAGAEAEEATSEEGGLPGAPGGPSTDDSTPPGSPLRKASANARKSKTSGGGDEFASVVPGDGSPKSSTTTAQDDADNGLPKPGEKVRFASKELRRMYGSQSDRNMLNDRKAKKDKKDAEKQAKDDNKNK